MAEVLAVFGSLSAVLQVVDFTAKLITHTHELVRLGVDTLRENIETEKLAREYKMLADSAILITPGNQGSSEGTSIERLSKDCRNEARILLKLLDELRMKAVHRGAERFKEGVSRAVKSIRSHKKIEHHRKHLQELNGLLATSLLVNLNSRQKLNSHDSPGSDHTEGGSFLTEYLLRHDSVDGDDNRDQIDSVIEKAAGVKGDDVRKITHLSECTKTENLRQTLCFQGHSDRWNAIVKAYPTTYRWVLEDDSLGFTSWLREGKGIYWINGKAGSGKSTLVKFLSEQQATVTMLKEWAGDSDLVFASFYFWYLGDPLQKTIQGLCQSILYQILKDNAELAKAVFPGYFKAMHHSDERVSWSENEVANALATLAMRGTTERSKKKYCLMIDGLDEFHGNTLDLLALLDELVENPDVKICASSRPWNAFRDAYELTKPNLRLEDLSRNDNKTYIRGSVQDACDKKGPSLKASRADIETLTEEIADGAEGVFLWTYLVVRSVITGIAEGEKIDFLRHRVNRFPRDLNTFFQHILGRTDDTYQQQTCQALKLAYLYAQENGPARDLSSFVDYWLIQQHPQGLVDASFPYNRKRTEISMSGLREMYLETRTFLSASCKDLLSLPSPEPLGFTCIDPSAKVEFLHRTVFDFLTEFDIQSQINKQCPEHFKSPRIFHLLNLARLKYKLPNRDARLEDMAHMSMNTANVDMCENYAADFEEIVYSKCAEEKTWYLKNADALAYFVVNRRYNFALHLLTKICPDLLEGYLESDAAATILKAALGDWHVCPIAVHNIDLKFLRHIFEDPTARSEMFCTYKSHDAGCCQSPGQHILRKWWCYQASSDQRLSPDRRQRESDFYELLKIVICHDNHPSLEFCVTSTASPGQHDACQVKSTLGFLGTCLPKDLFNEISLRFKQKLIMSRVRS